MGKFIDLTGTVFYDFTVVGREPNKVYSGGRTIASQWRCRCICGQHRVMSGSGLKSGNRKGCGCKQKQRSLDKKIKSGTAFRKVVTRYKADSKEVGRAFELTLDQCATLFEGDCYYCGGKPSRVSKALSGEVFVYNGIDRVDSSKGYISENCVSCCSRCNLMKGSLNQTVFIERCKEICRRFDASSR